MARVQASKEVRVKGERFGSKPLAVESELHLGELGVLQPSLNYWALKPCVSEQEDCAQLRWEKVQVHCGQGERCCSVQRRGSSSSALCFPERLWVIWLRAVMPCEALLQLGQPRVLQPHPHACTVR